jgi:hypothetical protein
MNSAEKAKTPRRQPRGQAAVANVNSHHPQYSAEPDARQASVEKKHVILLDGRPVASVEPGGILWRWAKPDELLHTPAAFCFHPQVLAEAKAHGATLVKIDLRHDGIKDVYVTPIENYEVHGLPIRRGFGAQIGLTLGYWRINGKPSDFEAKQAAHARSEAAGAEAQPRLF